ncbi:tRNA(Ile) lysidine-34 synthase, putative [Syntrophotalea carbinolica DSM 2380]|uniref:tRNA(Ile)-lysidine synthase n=1 Tax=Syntrophotalea carbinolica (strain DSM 2380 / NBRC 103641 / GraBd1) TaxID=338963 RepID=Q3A5W0_SYNC1|nr:tRNA lysidine(34) synthetase TilS [Syntrophotalea carbinolica]ABA88247.1 tRNA(Ile) lysidine-34 synthase, putative [Syntrophotalea carbinolica DSM 2380]
MQALFKRILVNDIQVSPGDAILVGLSGGADSMVLLDVLLHVADSLQLAILAAHLDHGMRPESADDAAFVARFCRRRDVPLTVGHRDVPALARQHKQGLEEAAREARREFLQQTARVEGCRFIALGHHRNDQVETFLHRLLRGSGLSGLAGMRLRSGPFIRPLLSFSRQDILAYLDDHQIPHVEDASNADTVFTRNRLRHELLPRLRDFNPRIEEHLARLSRRIAVEEDYWTEQVDAYLESSCEEGDDGLWLSRQGLTGLHPALRSRVLRGALLRLRGDLRGIGAKHLASLDDLLDAPRSEAEAHLPGVWAARRYERLWLRTAPPPDPTDFAVVVPGPGVYDLPGGGRLSVSLNQGCLGEDRWATEFDADKVPFPLLVRPFRKGDRFYPCGAPGHRKLKDFFIDAKIDREIRRSWPLVVADEILWLPGLRRGHGRWPQTVGGRVLRLVASGLSRPNQSL